MNREILGELEEELSILDEDLKKAVYTRVSLIKKPLEDMINSGGKRLRPAMVLAAARFGDYDFEKVKPLAVAIELIHTATLVHDDIIDDSPLRRGVPSIQSRLGKDVAVFAGDFIFCRVFELLASFKDFDILQSTSKVVYRICEGEIKQREDLFNTGITVRNYLYRIQRKTALLFALSCKLGAMAAKAPEKVVSTLYQYGIRLGTAFQIIDDLLDVTGDKEKLGKPAGVDIREGVITLPAIFALNHSPRRGELKRILDKGSLDREEVNLALSIIKESGGVEFAERVAKRYIEKAKKAIEKLPEIGMKKLLFDVADFIYSKNH
ncbi:polyprenyl synthetase family protein [Thermoanaerobacterium sp. DL9XJH110]|uniref:polyprenyl synthetase family protein n=1 Tax=Thermoanaerobacterium sp. DL9XJH110 TaxID=3386643 RepID=UPI003BB78B17